MPVDAAIGAACPAPHRVNIEHLSQSHCELCGVGEVRVRVTNNGVWHPREWQGPGNWRPGYWDPDLTNLVIREDLGAPDLVPVPGSSTVTATSGNVSVADPTFSGGRWVWDFGDYELPPDGESLELRFRVRRANGVDEEGLFTANRHINATLAYSTDTESCPETSDSHELRLLAPDPAVTKRGRNVDAAQTSYTETIYGHNNDDVIWRIQIDNNGNAPLQDLKFSDLMQAGNMHINYACPTEAAAAALAAANGAGPSGMCVPASNTLNDWEVAAPFGQSGSTSYVGGNHPAFTRNLNGREVDVPAGGSSFVYLVGKITADGACIGGGRTNTVNRLEFGCEADGAAAGGIADGTSSTARLRTRHGDVDGELTIDRRLTGINPGQPLGGRGYVTLTVTNNTGGTVRDIHLEDVLPPEYVVDPTYWVGGLTKSLQVRTTPRVGESSIDPLYGRYDGMVDRLTWENPQGALTPDSQDPLQNTAPQLRLTSSTTYSDAGVTYRNLLRHGDTVTITFPVVLISQNRSAVEPYDIAANLDVTPERIADGTDPAYAASVNNRLTVDYDTLCTSQGHQQLTYDDTFSAFPEDLDVAIGGSVFILTDDRSQELTLPVMLTNNGGHDASDYRLYVTFGTTMEVVGAPAGCTIASHPSASPSTPDWWQPTPLQVWVKDSTAANSPVIPSTATVYECTAPASIRPGRTVTYAFDVVKTSDPNRVLVDDLTFRADVIGQITLHDGQPLWFPTPIERADGLTDPANNYTLDAVWARVIGFNLKKTQLGACTEDNPPRHDENGYELVQIGEDCSFHIETGGWFGFETPGFSYIAVKNIDVVDEIPNGQAFIQNSDPYLQSTPRIGVNGDLVRGPTDLSAPDERWFDWRFNVQDTNRIEEIDEWFRVDVITRLLNKPVDTRASPNEHGIDSFNVLNSTFDAVFHNNNTGVTETYGLGPDTVGYPNEPIRRVDLRVTEPQLEITHEVCNETLNGSGAACADFRPVYERVGDAYDKYIYRVTIENQDAAGGFTRAPAYDLVATVDLDPSGLEYVIPFDSDGLDNDGNGTIDEGAPGEGTITDNDPAVHDSPARITYSWEHSDGLLRLDAGQSVNLYYRVDPHDEISPGQWLRHQVNVAYDSLAGDSGAQNAPKFITGELAGARGYVDSGEVRAQMDVVEADPKTIVRLSNTPSGSDSPQPVSVGEEIEYVLLAHLPVSGLWDLRIEDQLVPGLSCVEAPMLDLNMPPYDVAGFRRPNGDRIDPITPSCGPDAVVWEIGDVMLTNRQGSGSRVPFPLRFIAQVENVDTNTAEAVLSNGGSTSTLRYFDEQGSPQIIEYDEVDVVVTEPRIELAKSFSVTSADAGDELLVTVNATNLGTAPAYNLRILDDLIDRNMSFVRGSVAGADPPDYAAVPGFDPDTQPVFGWDAANPKFALAPGENLSFTFVVRVHDDVQPLEVLDNTIQASWTSLPDSSTALNSTGSIGSDGAPDGMRNGALPNAGIAPNDYEATAEAAVTVPPLDLSKTDVNPEVVPTIGAHKRFSVEITLPEGIARGVRVRDDLSAGDVSYVLARDENFDVAYEFHGIASINGATPEEGAFLASAAPPVHDATGVVEWNIGEVATLTENDPDESAITPRIVITYYARIDNGEAVQAGTGLRNSVDLHYVNGEDPALEETLNAASGPIAVVEPALEASKSVQNLTRGTGAAQGGDILQYRVTIENTGESTAHDVNIADNLPADVQLHVDFTPTATVDGSGVAGFNPVPAVNAEGATVWGRDNGDNALFVPPGSRLELTYQVVVNQALTDLVNEVWVDWTSLAEHPTVYERTGAGCPDWTAPDDYCVGPASTTTPTTDTTALTKSVVADSFDADGSTATDAVLRVGDSVVYRLVLNLPEGRNNAVRIEDVLDPGLAFEGIVSINGREAAPFLQTDPFTHDPVQAPVQSGSPSEGIALEWTLGDIYNAPDQTPDNDQFVIEYRARVIDGVLPHSPSTPLNNTATLKYLDAGGAEVIDPARLEAGAQIEVRQPVLDETLKSDRAGGRVGAGTESDPYRVTLASDTMEFRLESCNATGLAPAYGLSLSDSLAPEFDEQSLGTPTLTIAGTVLAEGTDYTYTPPAGRGGTMHFDLHRPVPPGECLTVDYSIGFHTDIAGDRLWSNSVVVGEYRSRSDAPAQTYAPLPPAAVWMTNDVSIPSPVKQLATPSDAEATIGEEVSYTITVPGEPVNAVLDDVLVSDTLDSRLEFVSASAVDAAGNPLDLTTTEAGQDLSFDIGRLAAGEQAVITLVARVANSEQTVDSAGSSIINQASYTFAEAGQSWTSAPADALSIVEPSVSITKSAPDVAAPTAGDILTYTIELSAASGAAASDAFDLVLTDEMGPGLEYVAGTASVDGVPVEPTVDGPTMTWPNVDALAEGTTLALSYDVRVLDSVAPGDALDNTATVRWTSLPGDGAPHERTGELDVPYNDYVATDTAALAAGDLTSLAKTRLRDTFDAADAAVRIGDIVEYELRVGLQEGTHRDLVLTDTLPTGLAFEGVVSADFFGTPGTAAASVNGEEIVWELGEVVNPADGDAANDFLTIVYRARVLNGDVLAQTPSTQSLTNTAVLAYSVAEQPATPLTASESIDVLQPRLLLDKSAAPEGGDAVVEAGERILYTLEISNTGAAPAYDALIEDILPSGLEAASLNTVAMELVNAGTALPVVAPTYDPASGVARWDLDAGGADVYTVPPGETLRLTYEVRTESGLGAGVSLSNSARLARYYSFDDEAVPEHSVPDGRAVYGPSDTASVTLTSAAPGALVKETTRDTAAVGEQFSYHVIVPAEPVNTALYDVRILDDLSASAADLRFVSVEKVSTWGSWTPVNTGTDTQLVIEDTGAGIDIPAGEQAVVEITLELLDTAANVSGLAFVNTADYAYNRADDDEATRTPGQPGTSPEMHIVGPDALTLRKSGPARMQLGEPAGFTLDVQNTGDGRAWDITVVDQLPDPSPGGMCDAAPTAIEAQVFEADGVTAVSPLLVEGTDFISRFVPSATTAAGEPACELIITGVTAAAALDPQQRLLIGYQAQLDADTVDGATLTNIAGATEWFSADTDGGTSSQARVYTRDLTDGTVGVLDHEDAFTVDTDAPVLVVQKTVTNVTSGQDPGRDAQPGDTLRYTITVANAGPVATQAFSLRDELDRLNAPPAFVAGSLNLVGVPAGADPSGTDPGGGAAGTGQVEIHNLQLDEQGGANDRLVIEFEARLAPVITNGTVVRNQGELLAGEYVVALTDDPAAPGDEDPTETRIDSAPVFEVWKSSRDISEDTDGLLAGDTLRYTIQIANIGSEDAVDVVLRDSLPAHTSYVASSTTLNGAPVADPSPGVLPLEDGLLVQAPGEDSPGSIPADPTGGTVATVIFDVVIDEDVLDQTKIVNQGFVRANGAGSGPIPEEVPSDDPDTPTPGPTVDVVGNVPLVAAHKTVAIQEDAGSPGIVDPGDVLRYTIVVTNFGPIPATEAVLIDAVPADTTYVADSVRLNGLPVGQPDGGVSPLEAGIDISASDLTPPLPGPGQGVLSPGASATVTFDVRVNDGVPTGTVISNQGTVRTVEQSDEPTDADGDASNGHQPTEVVVGDAQALSINKEVYVVGGGPALAGGTLEYVVRVTNIGTVPATGVIITDDLDTPVPGQLSYVDDSASLNGNAQGVSFAEPVLSADYAATHGELQPGASATLRFRAQIDPGLSIGATITNTAQVAWNSPEQSAEDSVSIDVGGTPGAVGLNGRVWHDTDFDNAAGENEPRLADWTVEIYRSGRLLGSVVTDADGTYRVQGLAPNDASVPYELRFRAPNAGSASAMLGTAHSPFTDGLQRITEIIAGSGASIQNLNLPITPNGVVYDSVVRTPVAGATVTLLGTGGALPTSCFDDPAQQKQVTPTQGFYKFDLNFSDPACPAGGDYVLQVTPPASGYTETPSQIIPPSSNEDTEPFSVPGCAGGPDDAVGATPNQCEIQTTAAAPGTDVPARTAGTAYHLHLTLNDTEVPDERQVFNNHVPVDPELDAAVTITKTSPLINVTRGQYVPYTITLRNTLHATLEDLAIVDTFPAGFKYVEGSARVNGDPVEPAFEGGLQLRWDGMELGVDAEITIKLLLAVGAGVSEGEYVNRAQAFNSFTGGGASGVATATVRVIPDPTFDCTDITGKVFDDANLDGKQDAGEQGLGGVRVVTARGLVAKTDEHGRFHFTCAMVPDHDRGSNFILKLDDRSLPTGYRVTTENPRVQRATRGKMMKFNFGATLHRVVRLDVADGVFEPGSTGMRLQWKPRLELLLEELRKAPSVLRVTYLADIERESLVKRRLDALEKGLVERWEGDYPLSVETETFWRRGAPPER